MSEMKCGREGDLIDYLYGELDQGQKLGFQRHTQACTDCKTQLAAFTDIRESVVAWRNESLSSLTPSVPQAASVQTKPSALAAFRQFFDLSPLWVKGTVAFASLALCLFAAFGIIRYVQTAPEHIAASQPGFNSAPSVPVQDFNAQVERRVKEELDRRAAAPKVSPAVAINNITSQSSPRRIEPSNRRASTKPQPKTAPLSKLERQELAADLRLTEDDSNGDLILIGDRINQ